MLIDTSALVAILLSEAEAPALVDAILGADHRFVAAPSLVEASAVMLARKGAGGGIALDALMERLDIGVLAMSEDAARLGRLGYARFGKSVGSPAVLNYGDCLAYGVAMAAGEALLFKGEDFSQTDVIVAVY